MSAISNFLTFLRSAIYAIDVRDGIADAIEQCYNDVNNPTLKTEALEAALQTKIDEGEMAALTIGDGTITAAKLASGVIDNTLATSGAAADAKKTGDEIAAVKADLADVNILTDPLRLALADFAEKAYYKVDNGRTICNALITALYSDAYPRLKVVFNPGSTDITTSASLSDLKQYLTVTYYAEQGATGTEIASANYTLSGSLNEGMNIITVTYNNVVGSFLVNIVDDGYYNTFTWEWTSSESTFDIVSIDGNHSVSNSIVGINIPSSPNYKRKALLATRGTIKLKNQNSEETQYSMIPAPPTATGVSVNITPNTLVPAILVAKKDGDVYKNIRQSGWGSPGAASVSITPGNDEFILVVVKHGSNDKTEPIPTKYTLTFT